MRSANSIGRTYWMQFEARPPAGGEACDQAVFLIQRGSKRAKQRKNAPMRTSYSIESYPFDILATQTCVPISRREL